MVEFDPEHYVDSQRNDWNRVAGAWEEYDAWLDETMAPCNRFLIEKTALRPGNRVLDLGCGSGYPALALAQEVGADGEVIGLDIAEEMLEVARRKAEALGVKQVLFERVDVADLPFEPACFDAVTARFSLMFLPYLNQSLTEIHRVLAPGGVFAAVVWGAKDKNPYLALALAVLSEFADLPPPDPKLPGVFHLARPGDLVVRLRAVGFVDLTETEIAVEGRFESGQAYLDCLRQMAAPLQAAFNKIPAARRSEAEKRIVAAAEGYRRGAQVVLPGVALCVAARKPRA